MTDRFASVYLSEVVGEVQPAAQPAADHERVCLCPQAAAVERVEQELRAVDAHLGIASQLRRASTDANIPISMGLEAVTVGAGGTGGGAHTLREWFDPSGRSLGLKRVLLAVLALAEIE